MSEEKKTRTALPVQDGLTQTTEIVSGESRTLACNISFRPATGLRVLRYERDSKIADGRTYEALVQELIIEHVLEVHGVNSALARGAQKPKDSSVKELVKLMDAETLLGIVNKILESAWNVDKLLGN